MRATRRVATWGDAGRVRSAAWRRGGGALHGRGRSVSPAAGSRSPAGRGQHRGGRSPAGRGSIGAARSPGRARRQQAADHRQGVAASGRRDPLGRAWQHRGGAIPWQGVGSIGAGDHRQGVAASGRRDPLAGRGSSWRAITGRAWPAAGSRSPAAGRPGLESGKVLARER